MVSTTSVKRKQGDTYPLVATIKESGSAFDLTGATDIKIGIGKTGNHTGAVATADGTLTGTAGEITFNDVSAIADLPAATYRAEITFLKDTYRYTTQTFEFVLQEQIIE